MVVIKLLDVLTEIKGAEDTADKIEADAQNEHCIGHPRLLTIVAILVSILNSL